MSSRQAPRKPSTAKVRLLGCTVACVATVIAVAAPPALANHVSCGQTITEDTKLDSDLTCTGDGIVIGAPNITLDLDGHTISGDGGGGDFAVNDFGVENTAGYDGIEVKDGAIEGFDQGVRVIGAEGNHLHGLVVSGSGWGIRLFGSDQNSIKENQTSGNRREGILLTLSDQR